MRHIHEYYLWAKKLLESWSLIRENIFENFNQKRICGYQLK